MRDADYGRETRGICARLIHAEPPADHWPTIQHAEALEGCSSFDFYHGIGMPKDYEQARHCALVERESFGRQNAEEGIEQYTLQDGPGMLAMIYANGLGVERNWDVAIHMACETSGAPAAVDGRITRLAQWQKEGWSGSDYSTCNDITSGRSGGICASFAASIADQQRAAALASASANWPAERQQSLAAMMGAFADYAAQANEMNCFGGTLHSACVTGGKQAMLDQFTRRVQEVAQRRAVTTDQRASEDIPDGEPRRARMATMTDAEWAEMVRYVGEDDLPRYEEHRRESIAARRSFEPYLIAFFRMSRPDLSAHDIRRLFRDI